MTQNAETPRGLTGAFQKNLAGGEAAATVPQAPHLREVAATPGWPPVRIPGRPGWWRHHINGKQVDLPSRTPPQEAPHGQ